MVGGPRKMVFSTFADASDRREKKRGKLEKKRILAVSFA